MEVATDLFFHTMTYIQVKRIKWKRQNGQGLGSVFDFEKHKWWQMKLVGVEFKGLNDGID